MTDVKWPEGYEDGHYHAIVCKCSGHCLNCWAVLKGRQRFYCSAWCGDRYRSELALDERMTSIPQPVPSKAVKP